MLMINWKEYTLIYLWYLLVYVVVFFNISNQLIHQRILEWIGMSKVLKYVGSCSEPVNSSNFGSSKKGTDSIDFSYQKHIFNLEPI